MLRRLSTAFILLLFLISFTVSSQSLFPAIEKNGRLYGYIDTIGNFVHQPLYEKALPYHEGHALAMKNKKWGVINAQNGVVVPFAYDDTQGIVAEGKITVKKGDKWGAINLKNEVVIPFNHDYLSVFNEGFILGGNFVKLKGKAVQLDVAILSEKRLYLDYGSYKLPGSISNGKEWSLGKWPMVRDGFITLLFDHSFDYDAVEPLDKKFHYLIPHHVALGMPHSYRKEIKPGEVVEELPSFSSGYLLQVMDRGQADTLFGVSSWDPLVDYYMDDQVLVGDEVYRATRDSRGKEPTSSEYAWQLSRPAILPRFEMTMTSNKVSRSSEIQTNNIDKWDSGFDYYQGDLVSHNGNVYSADVDNRGKDPQFSNQWHRSSVKAVDTLFVHNFVTSNYNEEVLVRGASSFVVGAPNSYLITVNDSLLLLKQGWKYALKIPTSEFITRTARVSGGMIIVQSKASGRWGLVDSKGVTMTPYEFAEISDLNAGFSVARKDEVYGLLKNSGDWKPLPQYDRIVTGFTSGSTGK